MYVYGPHASEEGVGSLRTEVTDTIQVLGTESRSSQEQPVFLITEHLLGHTFFTMILF